MKDPFYDVEIKTFKVNETGKIHGVNPFTGEYLCPYMRKYRPRTLIETGVTNADSDFIECIQCRIIIDHLRMDHVNNIVRFLIEERMEHFYKTIANSFDNKPQEIGGLLNKLLYSWEKYDFKDESREEEEAEEKEKLQDLGEFMTTGEAAKKWNYGKTTVKRMVNRGDIDAKMINGQFAIPIDHPKPKLQRAPNGKGKKFAAAAEKKVEKKEIKAGEGMSIKEAANRWGLSYRTVKRLIEDEKVYFEKRGSSYILPKDTPNPGIKPKPRNKVIFK